MTHRLGCSLNPEITPKKGLDAPKSVFIILGMHTQNSVPKDWHPADVKAALEKSGTSLRKIAKEYGYAHIARVLKSPWWAAEQMVAKALQMPAERIWPSRYLESRERGQGMTRKPKAIKLAKKPGARA